jgi:hypothetical protein
MTEEILTQFRVTPEKLAYWRELADAATADTKDGCTLSIALTRLSSVSVEAVPALLNALTAAIAGVDRLTAAATELLAHWDEMGGQEQRKKLGIADHEFWSPAGRMVDTQFIADLRSALTPKEPAQ